MSARLERAGQSEGCPNTPVNARRHQNKHGLHCSSSIFALFVCFVALILKIFMPLFFFLVVIDAE